MDRLIVACVQQRMRLPQAVADHESDLRRFLRAAQNKNARLVVFPELAGLMLAPPLLADFRSALLKRADQGRRRQARLWQRLVGSLAGSLATAFHADFRAGISGLLDVAAADLWQCYVSVYGGLAREFHMTIVAPSAYLPDPADGVIRNIAGVFGVDGALLGAQAKVMLHPEDEDIARAGRTWQTIASEVGQIGIMLGSDVLYPEVGRLLAFQGAEILVTQGACASPALFNKIRTGMLARMQDNQLFGVASFLVGHNELSRLQRAPFIGKSAIFAPQELTPRYNGVLVEMGNHRSEGVLTAEWDFAALKNLWELSDTPVRKQLALGQAGQTLAALYAQLEQAPRISERAVALSADDGPGDAPSLQSDDRLVHLDELPVLSSYTTRWPLEMAEAVSLIDEADPTAFGNLEAGAEACVAEPASTAAADGRRTARPEDETEEMDALADSEDRQG